MLHALEAALDLDASYLVLPGLVPESDLETAMGRALTEHVGMVGVGMAVERCQAELPATADAFLDARSPRFRRNLRRAVRDAETIGISFEVLDALPLDTVMRRVLDVESRSWKGREGGGLLGDRMSDAFGDMARRLRATGRCRVTVARHDGRDIGFILGGVRGATYRGLQISYDDAYRASSVGHLLQWHEVRRCITEGVRTYDLGMPLDYKDQWSDVRFVTRSLVVRPKLRRRGH